MDRERPPQNPPGSGEPLYTEERLRLTRHYLQNLVHELSSPLTPLLGYLKLFQNKALGELTPLQQRCLASMQVSATRLTHLLDDLGTLLAMESGTYRLQPHPVDLVEIVHRALDHQGESAQNASIDILREIEPGEKTVLGDEVRLLSALGHLVSNGLKFNSPGGKLLVRVQSLEQGSGRWVRVETFDSGIGIQSEELEQVFQPFYQTDHTSTRRFGGAGLGLALVKRTIEIHGGTVWLESPPKVQPEGHFFRGVRAVVDLPLCSMAADKEE
ncbi:MAG: HAMP domain-containing histidine kinase, partial [Bradymonadales bacterium]|nr:HAMP domain-containing histidine kinase [Bradymonadales bacterium]